MVAGGRMNMRLVLVQTGRGNDSLSSERTKWADYEPAFVAVNLLEAVRWIVEEERCNTRPATE